VKLAEKKNSINDPVKKEEAREEINPTWRIIDIVENAIKNPSEVL
jgi:hypothetical protein